MHETKKLFSNSFIIFVGTIIGGLFSFAFSVLMGRYLGPRDYGEMTALMSLLMIISVAAGAILTVTMKYSSELYAGEKFRALKRLFSVFSRWVYLIALAILIICLILTKPIANYFSISNLLPVFISFLSLFFGLTIAVNKGILQGSQRFAAVSFIGALEMALRLALGIILVKIGFAVSGALSAVVLATAISYFITFVPINTIFRRAGRDLTAKNFKFDRREILNYSQPALIATVLLIIAQTLDIILIKHYFSPTDAGVYSAISTLAKIVLYITGPVVTVMFPMISEKKTKGIKHYPIFFYSLLFVVLGSLLVLGADMIAPAKIISIYGKQYVGQYQLLPLVALGMLFYSLINLLVNYYLVIKDFKFIWLFVADLLIMIGAIHFWHSSILTVVHIIIASFGLLFVAMMLYYLFSKKSQIKLFLRGEQIT